MGLAITATTMEAMEANKMERKGFGISLVQLSVITSVASMNTNAAEFEFTPSVSATLNYVERVTDSRDNFFAGEITPRALVTYRSSNVSASMTVNNRNIYRDTSDDSFESYLTSNYNVQYELYDQSIFLYTNGSQQYNSINSSNLLINDLVTNPDDLTKTRNNTGGLRITNLGNSWVTLSSNLSASLFESERSSTSETAFDTKSYRSSLSLDSGSRFSFFRWSLGTNYREIQRNSGFDTMRRNSFANTNFAITDRFFLVAGFNESKQDLNGVDSIDTYRTYNAGVLYQNQNNLLRIAYNSVSEQSTFSENDNSGFYSIDFRVQLSPRTSFSGSKDQAFYGDTESFSFIYASRKLRATATYSEEVTSNSSIFDSNGEGVFVCPDNYLTIDDCFVPDSLSYELQPGEQFTDLSTFQDDINDSERVRKNWVVNTGYQFNRLTVSLQGRRLQSLYFDDTPDSLQHSFSTSLTARLGVRTSLSASVSYIKTEFDSLSRSDSETYVGTVGMSFRIKRNFTIGIQSQYRDLDSLSQFENYQERRFLITLYYSPNSHNSSRQQNSFRSN